MVVFSSHSFGGGRPEYHHNAADSTVHTETIMDGAVTGAKLEPNISLDGSLFTRILESTHSFITLSLTSVDVADGHVHTSESLLGGIVERDCVGLDRNDITESATQVIEAISQHVTIREGLSFRFILLNNGTNHTLTLLSGTGVTLKGAGSSGVSLRSSLLVGHGEAVTIAVVLKSITEGAEEVVMYVISRS